MTLFWPPFAFVRSASRLGSPNEKIYVESRFGSRFGLVAQFGVSA